MKNKQKKILVLFAALALAGVLSIFGGMRASAETVRYTVSYYDGTQLLTQKEYAAGETIEEYSPQKQGFLFMGWYLEEALGNRFEQEVMPAENLRLYAFYRAQTYSLTYELGGGDFESTQEVSYSYTVETPVVFPVPVKDGFEFGGWYKSASLSGSPVLNTNGHFENLTLYAAWIAGEAAYRVEYYKEALGGGYARAEYLEMRGVTGQSVEAPQKSYEGFIKAESGLNQESGVITGDGLLVLKLYFNRETYRIDLISPNGNQSVFAKYDERVSFPELTREGYIFKGWYYESECVSPSLIERMPLGGATLYAGWEAIHYRFVCIARGEVFRDTLIAFESPLDLSENTPGGYRFIGFFTDEACAAPLTLTNMPARDLTVYASYQPIRYRVRLNLNGGETEDALSLDFTVEEELSLPVPKKKGYYFGGWFPIGSGCKGVAIASVSGQFTQDLDLEAWWGEYFVEADNGSEIVRAVPDAEGKLYLPSLSAKEGYEFAGWYRDKECTMLFRAGESADAETKLYAGWSKRDENGNVSKTEYVDFRSPDLLWLWILLGVIAAAGAVVISFFAYRRLKKKNAAIGKEAQDCAQSEEAKEEDEEKK